MILGKLFNTAVLASLWNLANTCSSLKKSKPPSGSSKPLRIEKTRDYHRFLHPGNPSSHQKPPFNASQRPGKA
jgi:hypothetical protein